MMSAASTRSTKRRGHRLALALSCSVVILMLTAGFGASSASASSSGLSLESMAMPTNFAPGDTSDYYELAVSNAGFASDGSPITFTDTVPAGLTVTEVSGGDMTCAPPAASTVSCVYEGVLPARSYFVVTITVSVAHDATGTLTNSAHVSGGGYSEASASEHTVISPTPAPYGIHSFDGEIFNQDGSADTQAGAHPWGASTTLTFNTVDDAGGSAITNGSIRDIKVNLPPGFVGNTNAVPQCTDAQLTEPQVGTACPDSTQVGVAAVGFSLGGSAILHFLAPIYNMVPPAGSPALFAFRVLSSPIYLNASVRTGSDNGVTVTVEHIPQALDFIYTKISFWGVPADPSHDPERGSFGQCSDGTSAPCAAHAPLVPFLTLPTSCTQAGVGVETTASSDSWSNPGIFDSASFISHLPGSGLYAPQGPEGCDRLAFGPALTAAPDTAQADTPAGLTAEVKVSQDGLLSAQGVATADLRNTEVTLPAGVVINPGQAAGLVACQPGEDAIGTEAAPSCPAASKVGTVQISTPLLPHRLEGTVYILPSNPPNLQLLVAASADGVNLKLVGDVHLNETTGQLTTTFRDTPQLPFTDLKLSFNGGAQAALATPTTCGVYTTAADFTPWSAPFEPHALSSDSFAITSGPGGSSCPSSSLPFSPSLIAGTTTDQAGGYTDFSLLLQRGDGQQRVGSLQFKTPEGLLGMIRTVPLCPEADAASGACPAGSQIGHTVVAAGPGPYPLVVPQPGQAPAPIYLSGPYKGAPYGLVIAVPVIAGPFNLGTVVVRASIAVDPHSSQLTITTDFLPSILDGVPTDLRTINAVIDRPGFMFNPTSCSPMSFGGTATSTEGANAAISSHFQVGSCQSLAFKPNFKVSTSGRTSRRNGASLDAKIVYPSGALGANQATSQANIASVKVDLPKQLPSRLTTLQKACTDAVFAADPAACPAASRIGSAKAITPLLANPLSGPAYFVSHGGQAFPDLEVVLQGQGIRVDLVGSTFISAKGITSSTFKSVPDVPITSFELSLPEGPYSALAANGNLCKSKLVMPTAFVGQNGAVIHQSTPITTTGCPKAKHATKKSHRAKAKAKRRSSLTLRGH